VNDGEGLFTFQMVAKSFSFANLFFLAAEVKADFTAPSFCLSS